MSAFDGKPVGPRDYAALSAGWASMLGALLVAARDRGEDPVPPTELVPLGLATFALAKLVAKEKVAAEIREPFVEETSHGRRPRGSGLRYAVGEMLTCTRCVGFWSALGLTGLHVLRPREDPEVARNAPYTTPVRRLDEAGAAKRPVIRQPV